MGGTGVTLRRCQRHGIFGEREVLGQDHQDTSGGPVALSLNSPIW